VFSFCAAKISKPVEHLLSVIIRRDNMPGQQLATKLLSLTVDIP